VSPTKWDDDAFAWVVLNDEPLIAVLRGQMFIEAAVEDLIGIAVKNADYLLAEMDFYSKVRAAKSMGMLYRRDETALQAVAKLRNEFAHDIQRRTLTEEDDKAMVVALKGEYREAYDRIVERLGRESARPIAGSQLVADHVGWATRLAFAAVCTVLNGLDPEKIAQRLEGQ